MASNTPPADIVASIQNHHDNSRDLRQDLRGLLEHSRYSDFTIKCQERSWKVHKIVLASRSKHFSKVCDGLFKESSDAFVTLEEDDHNIVNAMIKFIYTADYKDDEDSNCPLTFNVKVFTLADKYDLEALAVLALHKCRLRMASLWDTPDFADAIKLVYTSAPNKSELRKCFVEVVSKNSVGVIKNDRATKLRNVMREIPSLAVDTLAYVVGASSYSF